MSSRKTRKRRCKSIPKDAPYRSNIVPAAAAALLKRVHDLCDRVGWLESELGKFRSELSADDEVQRDLSAEIGEAIEALDSAVSLLTADRRNPRCAIAWLELRAAGKSVRPDLELSQAALAKLHEAERLLAQVRRDPPGVCAGEARRVLLRQAIGMLTPSPALTVRS